MKAMKRNNKENQKHLSELNRQAKEKMIEIYLKKALDQSMTTDGQSGLETKLAHVRAS